MNISVMRPARISPFASARVMVDHFPATESEVMFKDMNADSRELAMDAGALCLYAATLLTQVHEDRVEDIKYEASEREQVLKEMIKSKPKYEHFTDEQVCTMVHNMILKDIRNSFAHGNFEIDYDVYSKRLNYILKPQRKDFVVDKPIIISKQDLFDINRQQLKRKAMPYTFLTTEQFSYKVKSSHGEQVKDFLLAADMLRFAENYLNPKLKHYEKFKNPENRSTINYYALLVSQMTYEQNDYYKLFDRDSNVFAKIAHIRNSMAHGGYNVNIVFDKKSEPTVSYQDRTDIETEPLSKIVTMLKIIREDKWLIEYIKRNKDNDEYTQKLIGDLKTVFDELFVYGGYEQGDLEELTKN